MVEESITAGMMVEAAVREFKEASEGSSRTIIRLTSWMIALVVIQSAFVGLLVYKEFFGS